MRCIIFITTFLVFFTAQCFAQFKFGAGLETEFDILGVKAQVHYQFDEQWGGQISGTYFLSDLNPSFLNFDAHYMLTTAGDNDNILLSGIGGLNYWTNGVEGAGGELGFNVGANLTFPITDNLDLFIEPKITFASIGDFFLAAGVYF